MKARAVAFAPPLSYHLAQLWRDLDIFDCSAPFDPSQSIDALLKQVPARWVVYLLADEQDRPVQLLCVKNLRLSLKRRLSEEPATSPSKRVDYRQLVRHVHWCRVDSTFEADWIYLEAARRIFPESYQGMLGFRPAWFIHVNPDTPFPRYTKTTDLSPRPGELIGPVEDKHAAARLIELVEDCFDLCRYYNILLEAPAGKACAYKEMGKCPAPCDGTISMDQYRQMVRSSAEAIVEPAQFVRQQHCRMEEASGLLQFELAAKLKARMERASELGKGAFRHARRLETFRFLSLQKGPRDGTAKLFLITPGNIEEVAGLIDEPISAPDLLRFILARAVEAQPADIGRDEAERIAIASSRLFSPKRAQGKFLPLDLLDATALRKAFTELLQQKDQKEADEEGLLKELQAMP